MAQLISRPRITKVDTAGQKAAGKLEKRKNRFSSTTAGRSKPSLHGLVIIWQWEPSESTPDYQPVFLSGA